MKRLGLIIGLTLLPFACALTQNVGLIGTTAPINGDPTTLPLFTSSPFVMDCTWHFPDGANFDSPATISPGPDASNNTIYMQNRFEQWYELSIPACDGTATILQGPSDVTHGVLGNPGTLIPGGSNETMAGGNLVWNNQLLITGTPFYDTGQVNVFMRKPTLNFATNDIIGPLPVSGTSAHYYTGAMGLFPSNWATKFGKPAYVVESTHGIVSTTSYGNAFGTFDPADIVVSGNVAVHPWMYHDGDHQLNSHPVPGSDSSTWTPFPDLDPSTWTSFATDPGVYDSYDGDCGERNTDGSFNPSANLCFGYLVAGTRGPGAISTWWNGTYQVAGAVIAKNHRSLLYLERAGLGKWCYGNPQWAELGPYMPGYMIISGAQCQDETDKDHGLHAWPYTFRVLAFDLKTIIESANPQTIKPYAVWESPLDCPGGFPCDNNGTILMWSLGMGCDNGTPIKCYFAQRERDSGGKPLMFQMHIAD